MRNTTIQAVLLAAGQAKRFGGGKLVQPLEGGVPLAVQSARNLKTAGFHVTAVVRPEDHALQRLLEREGCAITPCAEAVHGMGHSLAHGVRATADAAGWIIALADMPRVQPATIALLSERLRGGATVVAPRYRGHRGHPVCFAAPLRKELLALAGDTGARAVMQSHSADLVLVDCDDPGVLYDVDVPADLQRPV